MYPDERVSRLIRENFLPVRLHIKQQPKVFERFGALWTPTVIVLDSSGTERHRIEGFLAADDFLSQLLLGLGHMAFALKRWGEAERRFEDVLDTFPRSEAAAEAQYWKGVTKYKATGDGAALRETAVAFQRRYGDSSWAKKASVWR